jgi:hypothetical protein
MAHSGGWFRFASCDPLFPRLPAGGAHRAEAVLRKRAVCLAGYDGVGELRQACDAGSQFEILLYQRLRVLA